MFKVCGKTKYARYALRLHAQLNAILTPKEAHCLRWNRTINLKGGVGSNVAIDQVMEHNIRETKELMYADDANLNFICAQIYSTLSNPIKDTIYNFDHEIKLQKQSSKHKRRKDGGTSAVIKFLQHVKVLKEIQGRAHQGIGILSKDPFSVLDFRDLSLWLTIHNKSWVNPYYN